MCMRVFRKHSAVSLFFHCRQDVRRHVAFHPSMRRGSVSSVGWIPHFWWTQLPSAGNPDFGTLLISAPASPVIGGSNFQASPRSMVDVLAPCTHHPTYNNEGLPLGVSILLSPFGNRVLEREGASACLVNHVDGLPQPSW